MEEKKEIEGSLNVDENIVSTKMKKEVNSSSLHQKDEKDTMKLLAHIIDPGWGGVFPRKWHSGEEKMKEEG